MSAPLQLTESGLYCPAGDFYVDPWAPVERAIITHGHSDHCRWGMERYLTAEPGLEVLRTRLGADARIDTIPYGQTLTINGVKVSLHPAGHLLGSAQVRIEDGTTWVVSGDYKTERDPTCEAFEPIRCHGFVTESTFGLPIYRWKPDREIFAEIDAWWAANQAAGKCSIIAGYSLGKAQRLLAGVGRLGPIVVHGAISRMNEAYRWAGVKLPQSLTTHELKRGFDFSQALVVCPPGATATPWIRRFGDASVAYASGWMAIRGIRRRMNVDRGFVLSDHVDWPSLLGTIEAAGAEEVWVTHGYAAQVVRYLGERGVRAKVLPTRFTGEEIEGAPEVAELALEDGGAGSATLTPQPPLPSGNGEGGPERFTGEEIAGAPEGAELALEDGGTGSPTLTPQPPLPSGNGEGEPERSRKRGEGEGGPEVAELAMEDGGTGGATLTPQPPLPSGNGEGEPKRSRRRGKGEGELERSSERGKGEDG